MPYGMDVHPENDLKTPIKKAKGLGSAHTGAHHWWMLKLSSLALIPLSIWFIVAVGQLLGAGYDTVITWFNDPVNAFLAGVSVAVTFHHAALGGQAVIEDYIHHKGWQLFFKSAYHFACFTGGVIGVFIILMLYFSV